MGRMAFSSENRTNSKQEYPKLKLEKNEVARIVIIEKEPWREFVHTLTMPKIEDGTVVMQTRQRRDGSEFQEHATDFVGRPLCLGDEETMLLRGSDPDNCPLCSEAISSPGVIPVAVPRFAAQVLKYATKPGSATLRTPFSVELAVWNSDKDIAPDHGGVDFFQQLVRSREILFGLMGQADNDTCGRFNTDIVAHPEGVSDLFNGDPLVDVIKNALRAAFNAEVKHACACLVHQLEEIPVEAIDT